MPRSFLTSELLATFRTRTLRSEQRSRRQSASWAVTHRRRRVRRNGAVVHLCLVVPPFSVAVVVGISLLLLLLLHTTHILLLHINHSSLPLHLVVYHRELLF